MALRSGAGAPKKNVEDKKITRQGSKEKILFPIINELYQKKCDLTHLQIKNILEKGGIDVSLRTIFTILKKNKITRKRLKRRRQSTRSEGAAAPACAENLTPESKAKYKKVFNELIEDEEDALFFDEMHASNNILPLYGYSKVGIPCYITEALEHKAHSLLFAFSKKGNFFYKVYEGAMNTARCQWFVDNLPQIRLVMDNLAIHKSVKMPGFASAKGCRLRKPQKFLHL
jgi:hypothetical protein